MSELPKHQLIMTEIMPPEKSNFSGNIHGGYILYLLDRVAYACAARYSSSYVVTLSVDQVLFKKPIHVGELVTFLASINETGRTSMEVGIKVIAESLTTHTNRHTVSSYFSMVAVNENHKPTPVPVFVPSTDEEKRRYKEALHRKELRKEF